MLKTIALNRRKSKKKLKGKVQTMTRAEFETLQSETRIEVIKQLIPMGLLALAEELNAEVDRLAGSRYSREAGTAKVYRHGTNPGTVMLDGVRNFHACFGYRRVLSPRVSRMSRNSDCEKWGFRGCDWG